MSLSKLTWLGECTSSQATERAAACVAVRCGLIKATLGQCPDVDDFVRETNAWKRDVGCDDRGRFGGVLALASQGYAKKCIQAIVAEAKAESTPDETATGLDKYFTRSSPMFWTAAKLQALSARIGELPLADQGKRRGMACRFMGKHFVDNMSMNPSQFETVCKRISDFVLQETPPLMVTVIKTIEELDNVGRYLAIRTARMLSLFRKKQGLPEFVVTDAAIELMLNMGSGPEEGFPRLGVFSSADARRMYVILKHYLGDSKKLREFSLLDLPLITCEYAGLAHETSAAAILQKLPYDTSEQVKMCKSLGSGKWSDHYHTGLDELQASRRAVPFLDDRADLGENSAFSALQAEKLIIGPQSRCEECEAPLPTQKLRCGGRPIVRCQPSCDNVSDAKRRKTLHDWRQ